MATCATAASNTAPRLARVKWMNIINLLHWHLLMWSPNQLFDHSDGYYCWSSVRQMRASLFFLKWIQIMYRLTGCICVCSWIHYYSLAGWETASSFFLPLSFRQSLADIGEMWATGRENTSPALLFPLYHSSSPRKAAQRSVQSRPMSNKGPLVRRPAQCLSQRPA